MKLVSIVIPYKFHNNQFFFWNQKRQSSDELDSKFEFPGGKIENGEIPGDAAIREIQEEVGVNLYLEEIHLFKIFDFSKGLSIFVFLYEDLEEKFLESGFHPKEFYLSQIDKIMPNNKIVFNEVFTYLQRVKE